VKTPVRGGLLAALLVLAAAPVPELEQLLTALASAPSEAVASEMEGRISALWAKSGGPAVGLLFTRGARDLSGGAEAEAVADFDAAVALEPELAEAYARRAVARFQAGDSSGALRDAQEALQREPRHFGVWRNLSQFLEARGDLPGALTAWRKLLEVDPRTHEARERLLELSRKVEGEQL